MPLNVDQVSVTLDAARRGGAASSAPASPEELRELLRPIVLEILASELDRLRREVG